MLGIAVTADVPQAKLTELEEPDAATMSCSWRRSRSASVAQIRQRVVAVSQSSWSHHEAVAQELDAALSAAGDPAGTLRAP